jgi:hypothetical protein
VEQRRRVGCGERLGRMSSWPPRVSTAQLNWVLRGQLLLTFERANSANKSLKSGCRSMFSAQSEGVLDQRPNCLESLDRRKGLPLIGVDSLELCE